MNTDGTGFHTCKECYKTESLLNHTTTDQREGEQLEDRRSVGASSCNSGDGADQTVQFLMFMVMNYKAKCFHYRLVILRPTLFQLCHKMLCTLWDPIVFTSMEYIKLNRSSLRA